MKKIHPKVEEAVDTLDLNAVTRRLADTSTAAKRLGYRSEIDLRDGLAGLVDWWRVEKDNLR